MRRTAVCLLGLMIAAPASAEDQQWNFVRSKGDVRLFYGVPESDVVTLNIICMPQRRRINLVNFVLPPRPQTGKPVTMKFSNGAASLDYIGKVGRDRSHGVTYIDTRVSFDRKLFDFLKAGSTLTIQVPGKSEDVPLMGIAEPVAMMEQACLNRR